MGQGRVCHRKHEKYQGGHEAQLQNQTQERGQLLQSALRVLLHHALQRPGLHEGDSPSPNTALTQCVPERARDDHSQEEGGPMSRRRGYGAAQPVDGSRREENKEIL